MKYRIPLPSCAIVLLCATGCQPTPIASPQAVRMEAAAPHYHPRVAGVLPGRLEIVGQIDAPAIDESSGLALSHNHPGILWTHNDSGDSARIFAITPDGKSIHPESVSEAAYAGIRIEGAVNHDWEDIATGLDGTLYIGAFGNNANARRDLGIYIVPEPDPRTQTSARVAGFIPFVYPDQDAFPPAQMNFDCEALFYAQGSLYVLTKHRGDTMTKLYRLPSIEPGARRTLEHMATFDIGGMVTAADASPDGRRIAILTYNSVWLFEAESPGKWFEGKGSWLPFLNGRQCESVTFEGDSLLIGNEQRELFRVPVSDFLPLLGIDQSDVP